MHDRLTIVRPPALGAALARAADEACARPIAVSAGDLPLLDARLACGDFEGVLTVLRDARAAPALPLFLARYMSWSGDLPSAAAVWDTVLASLDAVLGDEADPGLRRATCVALARTATDLGDAPLAARLHAITRRHAAGSGDLADLADPADPADSADSPHSANSPHSADFADSPQRDQASRLIHDVAFNILGIEPDASRGRFRLRPRLDRFDQLEAHHIRLGDASVSMTALCGDEGCAIWVEQDAGSIPLTVLLEPFVTRPGTALVDGEPADLAPRTLADGTILPVQLVLDHARSLVIRPHTA